MIIAEKLTEKQLKAINELLKGEYNFKPNEQLKSVLEVDYQVFSKSSSIFSGCGVVSVYEYLKHEGIEVDYK